MPLREVLLIAIVASVTVAALGWPRIGLYGYLWYGLMRPDVLAWVPDERNKYSMIMAVALLLGSALQLQHVRVLFKDWISRMILALQIPIALSVIFAYSFDLAMLRYNDYVRLIVVVLLIPVLIRTEQHFRELLLVIVFSLGFVGLKFGVFALVHGGVELAGGYGPVLADNNFVALAFAMLIPAAWYAASFVRFWPVKVGLLGVVGATVLAVIMTNSRGGSVAMATALMVVVLRSKSKLGAVVLVGVCLAAGVYLAQDFYVDRMSSLQSLEEEASAMSRLWHAEAAVKMWLDYPLTGVGFGGLPYVALLPNYSAMVSGHVAHNGYLQMLADSGIVAFLLYTVVLIYAIFWLEVSGRSFSRTDPQRAAISYSIQGALIAFAVGSCFYSVQRIDLPYIFLMCASAWRLIVMGLQDEDVLAVPVAATAGSRAHGPISPQPAVAAPAAVSSTDRFRTAQPISQQLTSSSGLATRLKKSLQDRRSSSRNQQYAKH